MHICVTFGVQTSLCKSSTCASARNWVGVCDIKRRFWSHLDLGMPYSQELQLLQIKTPFYTCFRPILLREISCFWHFCNKLDLLVSSPFSVAVFLQIFMSSSFLCQVHLAWQYFYKYSCPVHLSLVPIQILACPTHKSYNYYKFRPRFIRVSDRFIYCFLLFLDTFSV